MRKIFIKFNYTGLRNEAHVEYNETVDLIVVKHNVKLKMRMFIVAVNGFGYPEAVKDIIVDGKYDRYMKNCKIKK
jgi:hypothetical protein